MIVYNNIINIIDGLILSGFIGYYLALKDKKNYITLGTILCYIQLTFLDYSNNFNHLLILSVIILLRSF